MLVGVKSGRRVAVIGHQARFEQNRPPICRSTSLQLTVSEVLYLDALAVRPLARSPGGPDPLRPQLLTMIRDSGDEKSRALGLVEALRCEAEVDALLVRAQREMTHAVVELDTER